MNRIQLIERYEKMSELEKSGLPSVEIGARFGISGARVRFILSNPPATRSYNRIKNNGEYHRSSSNENYRTATIKLLGGACKKCGYDIDIRALQIDHIYGDGYIDRRKNSNKFYRETWEAVVGGSDRFQVLCANCNFIKRSENREYKKSRRVRV